MCFSQVIRTISSLDVYDQILYLMAATGLERCKATQYVSQVQCRLKKSNLWDTFPLVFEELIDQLCMIQFPCRSCSNLFYLC